MQIGVSKLLLSIFIVFYLPLNIKAQNFDINTLKQTNLYRNQNLDAAFCGISNSIYYLPGGLLIGNYTIGILKKNAKMQKNAIEQGISQVVNGFITYAFKYGIKRDRPAVTYPFLMPLENKTTNSFPSGHTSTAFNTATIFSLQNKKWYYVVPAYTWAGAVGYSRMHMGVHYPTDVLGGALVGTASAYIGQQLNKLLLHNKKTSKVYNSVLW